MDFMAIIMGLGYYFTYSWGLGWRDGGLEVRFTNDSLGPGQAAAKELKAKLAIMRVY